MNKLCLGLAISMFCVSFLLDFYVCIITKEDAELCPHGWSASLTSRSCIRPFRKRTRWVNARTECQALGGDLLTNYDKEKGVVVNASIHAAETIGVHFWIGLNDVKLEGQFRWLDVEQEATNVPWYPNQPDNYGNENCVALMMDPKYHVYFYDQPCSFPHFYICESFSAEELCAPGYRRSETSLSCIGLFENSKTWADARRECQKFGADLLINYNKKKEDVMFVHKSNYILKTFWIGLNDQNNEGDFHWLDNYQKVRNVPWYPKQPDNNQNEDCVTMVIDPQLQVYFHDQPCNFPHVFICESFPGVLQSLPSFHGPERYAGWNFSGFCQHDCDDGYGGKRCDAPCHDKFFGAHCLETCSKNCGGPNNACNNVNGSCMFGCVDGYHGERCQYPCYNQTFGAKCSETCSKNCGGPNNACNNVNGSCMFGCVDGYHGEICEDPIRHKKRFTYSTEAVIASSTFGLVILACTVMSLIVREQRETITAGNHPEPEGKIQPLPGVQDIFTIVDPTSSSSIDKYSHIPVRSSLVEDNSNITQTDPVNRNSVHAESAPSSLVEDNSNITQTDPVNRNSVHAESAPSSLVEDNSNITQTDPEIQSMLNLSVLP
ncbi:hypothetical protein RRG08_000254 [Elysia crispata]|uniref:C-type lectin domain-containing protein n=1 Tax=Elysia crispata TaxID=231223 RepID=A0AAE0Y8F0_9GAST|nr:hypothetical protein RRG08_000254 [Elysia crispata]